VVKGQEDVFGVLGVADGLGRSKSYRQRLEALNARNPVLFQCVRDFDQLTLCGDSGFKPPCYRQAAAREPHLRVLAQ
jgi:hypothetical protein